MNRRSALLLALAGPLLAQNALARGASSSPESGHDARMPQDRPDEIAMLIYPNMAALDFVGPQMMFAMLAGANVRVVAKTRDPVATDTGFSVVPSSTLAECPRALTVLFVPGGTGTIDAIHDAETLAFVADRGARATYVTSVCTGSLLLGAAGLLKGYRATSHWSVVPVLERFGASPVRERVVRDRNRITGGGVTAGLDFGLTMVEAMRTRFRAQTVQLMLEYDPRPPFDAGEPQYAPAGVVAQVEKVLAPFVKQADMLKILA
jgi:cyclohexyl-isocyanide hydratase